MKRELCQYTCPNTPGRNSGVLYYICWTGNPIFMTTAAMAKQLSGVIPDLIVVGIHNTVRGRDLTPTHVKPDSTISSGDAAISGGSEHLYALLKKS